MVTLTSGTIKLDLGFVSFGAEFAEYDRQCAWELYTEITTRVAVSGKRDDPECSDFFGEPYIESLAPLCKFFQEAR